MNIPTTHPRYRSLVLRQKLEQGIADGITSLNGLIAHGRGEAFDYLIGEKTHGFAKTAIHRAAFLLQQATHPVISVNGNTAALIPDELVALATICGAPLEINIFHTSDTRIRSIESHLKKHGAKKILLPQSDCILPHLDSPRKYIHPDGIAAADVVFVPLEDGDRTKALVKNKKMVITVDLNPLSRTARDATVTIVDNIVRAVPLLIRALSHTQKERAYDNEEILRFSKQRLRRGGWRG